MRATSPLGLALALALASLARAEERPLAQGAWVVDAARGEVALVGSAGAALAPDGCAVAAVCRVEPALLRDQGIVFQTEVEVRYAGRRWRVASFEDLRPALVWSASGRYLLASSPGEPTRIVDRRGLLEEARDAVRLLPQVERERVVDVRWSRGPGADVLLRLVHGVNAQRLERVAPGAPGAPTPFADLLDVEAIHPLPPRSAAAEVLAVYPEVRTRADQRLGTRSVALVGAQGRRDALTTPRLEQGFAELLRVSADPSGGEVALLFLAGTERPERVIHVLQRDTQELRALPGSEGAVDLAYQPDGPWLAALLADGRLGLWSPRGRALLSPPAEVARADWRELVWAPGGRLLLARGGEVWTVELEETRAGTTAGWRRLALAAPGFVVEGLQAGGALVAWSVVRPPDASDLPRPRRGQR